MQILGILKEGMEPQSEFSGGGEGSKSHATELTKSDTLKILGIIDNIHYY